MHQQSIYLLAYTVDLYAVASVPYHCSYGTVPASLKDTISTVLREQEPRNTNVLLFTIIPLPLSSALDIRPGRDFG